MTLQFPTIAEQVKETWQREKQGRTLPLDAVLQRYPHTREQYFDHTAFVFEDDTRLCRKGTGASHKLWTELP